MQIIQLYLVCSSLCAVVTPTRPKLTCVADKLCLSVSLKDNFVCQAGEAGYKTYTNCEALRYHYIRWAAESSLSRSKLAKDEEEYEKKQNAFAVLVNVTSELTLQLDVPKGRQAVSAALAAIQFSVMVLYLLTVRIMTIVKKCKKKEAELLETQLEELESRLAERKILARRKASRPSPQEQ